MDHTTIAPSPPPAQVQPIEEHPDYPTVLRMASLDSDVLRHDLAAARGTAALLATFMANAKLLQNL